MKNMRRFLFDLVEFDEKRENTASTVYDCVMLLMIVIGIVPLAFRVQYQIFEVFDRVAVTVFVIDYLIRLTTADLKLGFKKSWLSFLVYPFTPMAVLDLLSILPSLGVLGAAFKMLRVARLMKIMRVFRMLRYSTHMKILLTVLKKESNVLLTVLGISVFYILVTALVMFNVEAGNTSNGVVVFDNFFDAIYWATTTLTTVGYGDIRPVSDFGRVVSMISSVFGVAIIALPSGVITAGYLDALRKQDKEDEENGNEGGNASS